MKYMTIDERIQALVASMEALRAGTQELREVMRVNHDSLHANLAELFEAMQRHDSEIAANSRHIAEVTKAIGALVQIVQSHERRIRGLEGEEQ